VENEPHDATLSDWILCELPGDRRFLAGKVIDNDRGRFREGVYITTSRLLSPVKAVADGNVVQTLNSRYLLSDRYSVDDDLFAKLDAWTDPQPAPPGLGEVLASGDIDLFAAYILRGFRQAAAEAVWERDGGQGSGLPGERRDD
jgi:hypothetical protein